MAAASDTSLLDRVAAEAGVSIRTVQRVLAGGNKQVWKSSARRAAEIRKIAEQFNYRPNGAARAMVTGSFGAVSLLLSTHNHRSYLPPSLLDGINDELAGRDLSLQVAKLPDEQLTDERKLPRLLRHSSSDGLLIDYTDHIPARMLTLLRKYKLPSVWINSRQATDCVYPDDLGAGRRAAEHLLAQGHRRIAFVDLAHDPGDPEEHYSIRDRRAGYEQAMQAAGLTPQVVQRSVLYADRGIFARQWLSQPDRPTAIIAYSGAAGGPIIFAGASMGLLVPRDLSVVVFDDVRYTSPGFVVTTLVVPQYDIGRAAVSLLVERIANPSRALPPRAVPFTLVEGQSVTPPPAGGN